MKRNVAIIGAGVSGLTAMNLLATRGVNVDVYSAVVGGDYLMGGLKYIHYNPYVEKFLGEEMGSGFYLQKIIGTMALEKGLEYYPEILWYGENQSIERARREYALKTKRPVAADSPIGAKNFLLNPEHVYKHEMLKVVPKLGLSWLIGLLLQRLQSGIANSEKCITHYPYHVSPESLSEIIQNKKYAAVIYTAPINVLLEALKINFRFFYSNLQISRFKVTNHISKIFWDYVYVPLLEYLGAPIPFYRLSRSILSANEVYVDAELPVNTSLDTRQVSTYLNFFARKFLQMPEGRFSPVKTFPISIKGDFNYSESLEAVRDKIPKNIFLLGRFAQWDRRMVWATVIERMYKEILPNLI